MSGLKTVLPKTRWLMLVGCSAAGHSVPLRLLQQGRDRRPRVGRFGPAWVGSPADRIPDGLLHIPAVLPRVRGRRWSRRRRLITGMGLLDSHGHGEHEHHNHEPAAMMVPLYVYCALGAIVAGYFNFPTVSAISWPRPSFAMAYDVATGTLASRRAVPPTAFGQESKVKAFRKPTKPRSNIPPFYLMGCQRRDLHRGCVSHVPDHT